MTTKSEIRKNFKSAGYEVAFRTNPLNPKLVSMTVKDDKGHSVVAGDVFSAAMIDQHREAFTLYNKYQGIVLGDSHQKIV